MSSSHMTIHSFVACRIPSLRARPRGEDVEIIVSEEVGMELRVWLEVRFVEIMNDMLDVFIVIVCYMC